MRCLLDPKTSRFTRIRIDFLEVKTTSHRHLIKGLINIFLEYLLIELLVLGKILIENIFSQEDVTSILQNTDWKED